MEQKIKYDNLNIKVFPEPKKEELKSHINKQEQQTKIITYIVGEFVWLAIFGFALTAFLKVDNYNYVNIGILLVMLVIAIILAFKLFNSFRINLSVPKAIITEVNDVTNTYESVNPEDKGNKKKLELMYNFKDSKNKIHQSSFMILYDKDKSEEIEEEIPSKGDSISIIYNEARNKVVRIYIPELYDYIQED